MQDQLRGEGQSPHFNLEAKARSVDNNVSEDCHSSEENLSCSDHNDGKLSEEAFFKQKPKAS